MISQRTNLTRGGYRAAHAGAGILIFAFAACTGQPEMLNPFEDLDVIPLDGQPHVLTRDITALGLLQKDDVLRLRVTGEGLEALLILAEDPVSSEAGLIAGGGRPGAFFHFRAPESRRYFAFIQSDPRMPESTRRAVLTVMPGDPEFRPPSAQPVLVLFEPGFLSNPGLFDPESGTPADQQFLDSISGLVREEVIRRLREVFEGTPIEILTESDSLPAGPISRLTFRPDRVLAENQDVADAALPPPDPQRPECQVRVVFGELLPPGTLQDPGNQTPDDEAVVYVGSFQGRGETCQTVILDSLSNIVLTLANTGAHEIGHLVGLYHIEQIDIMNRSATLAFQRELLFQRGQIQVDKLIGGQVQAEVLTTVVQDPAFYFQAAFGQMMRTE